MNLILIKIIVTVLVILGLTWVAEKTSPRMAGVLSGYPLGTALVLFFYGLQAGPGFAVASIPHNILGHLCALSFVYLYYLGSRDSTVGSVLLASLLALSGYAGAAALLSRVTLSLPASAALSLTSIAFFSFLFRKIPDTVIVERVRYTASMILFRLALSVPIVLLITGLAGVVGTRWAGLFSAFPLVVYPLLLLVHLHHGAQRAHTVLKNFPRGLWTVLAYCLTISQSYEYYGIYLGTAVGYAVATALLLAINGRIFLEERVQAISLGKSWQRAKTS